MNNTTRVLAVLGTLAIQPLFVSAEGEPAAAAAATPASAPHPDPNATVIKLEIVGEPTVAAPPPASGDRNKY